MATSTLNGKPRKQLADQLDRLDGLIDTLAEGLNQAVADACREGTRLAVKDVLTELLSNPELRALLVPPRPAPAPPEPNKPGPWARIKARIAAARDALIGPALRAKHAAAAKYHAARATLTAAGTVAGEALPVRRILCTAVIVGAAVGVVCLVLPQTAAAAVSAVSASTATVVVQTGTWLKRAATRFGLLS